MKIMESVNIKANPKEIIKFFEYISDNPKKYSFNTHVGVTPISGDIQEVGSTFMTTEKFLLFSIRLKFETVAVDPDSSFTFRLTSPFGFAEIFGAFSYEQIDPDQTKLNLIVYQNSKSFLRKLLSFLIFLPPVSLLIKSQLQRELRFIKNHIEQTP